MDFSKRDEYEAQIAENLGKLGEKQRREIIRLLGNPPKLENLQFEYWTQYSAELQAVLGRDLEAVYLDSAAEFMESQPILGVDWSLINKDAVAYSKQYGYNLVTGLTNTTRDGLRDLMPQFFEQQMTIGELRERLGRWYGPVRAEMIAATEVTRAAVEGERAVVAELNAQGIQMTEIWQTNNDEIVCPLCGPLNGKVLGDGWTRTDGPPRHVRCRCWITHELIMPEGAEIEPGKPWLNAAGTVLDKAETSATAIEKWMLQGLPNSYAKDGIAKNELVTELARRSGVDYDKVNDLVAQWAQSSNDNDMRSLAIQEDMAKILGIDLPKWQADKIALLTKEREQDISILMEGLSITKEEATEKVIRGGGKFFPLMDSETQQTILRSMYEYTQERLDAEGIGDTVRLYRGMHIDKSVVDGWMSNAGMEGNYNMLSTEKVEYHGSVLESWSSDIGTASGFSKPKGHGGASVVFQMDIPRSRIMGSARSGLGCLDEREFVHLGAFNDEVARIARIKVW